MMSKDFFENYSLNLRNLATFAFPNSIFCLKNLNVLLLAEFLVMKLKTGLNSERSF